MHEAAIELVEIPRRGMSGKNSADIRLVVDAIDLAYSKDHIDTFVIVSGDSDFSPLVSKLKELGKHVIGLGLVDATSDLLRDNCDEFIYYEDLDRAPLIPVGVNDQVPERKRKVFSLLLDTLLALRRENKEIIYSSMLKDTIKRKKPSFNEEYYGYRTFSELLEDAQREGLLEIEKHKPSGMYIVTRFGLEMKPGSGVVARSAADGRQRAEAPKQPDRRDAGRGRGPDRQPVRRRCHPRSRPPRCRPPRWRHRPRRRRRPNGRWAGNSSRMLTTWDRRRKCRVTATRKATAKSAAPARPQTAARGKSEPAAKGGGGRRSSHKAGEKPKSTAQGRRRPEPKPAPPPKAPPRPLPPLRTRRMRSSGRGLGSNQKSEDRRRIGIGRLDL